jgi:hypothetical protein
MKKYGFLTVIADLGTKPDKSGHKARWVRCKCDCGKLKVCRFTSVKMGVTRSCGCLTASIFTRKEKRHNHVISTNKYRNRHKEQYLEYSRKSHLTIGARYSVLKYHSKKRRFELLVTREQFEEILKSPCHYCGEFLFRESGYGLDRIDNSKGYSLDNILPCCGSCNRTRGDRLTVEEMEFVMTQLLAFRKRKEISNAPLR